MEKFEYERGYKFSTYATLDKTGNYPFDCRPGQDYPVPVHMTEIINKYFGSANFCPGIRQDPLPEEIAKEMRMSQDKGKPISSPGANFLADTIGDEGDTHLRFH